MHIQMTIDDGLVMATLAGRFDAHTVREFTSAVLPLLDDRHPSLALDMCDVEFMDSSALAALVTALKRCTHAGGAVLLAGVSDAVRIILELTRLDDVFPDVGSFEAARRTMVTA